LSGKKLEQRKNEMNAKNWMQNEKEIKEETQIDDCQWLADWADAMEELEEEQAQPATGTKSYYPEMKEERPEALMDARLSHYGKHYFVDVHPNGPVLKGRGIIDRTDEITWVPGSRKQGWKSYKVTIRAYKKIEAENKVAYEVLLD